jgi:hypothetical protein
MYFEIDKTHKSTFGTKGRSLLKDSIGGNALIEGVAVMIVYEGQEYQADMQATIIKLNSKSFFNILVIVAFIYNYIVIINACMI